MRRQANDGGTTAGSSRCARLDPFALPLRFAVSDPSADAQSRIVELWRDRVLHRRAVRGIPMAVKVPVAAYLGVAIKMEPPQGDDPGAVAVVLVHQDAGLSLPLYRSEDGGDIVAEWQCWGRALGLPLLVTEPDGSLRAPFNHLGGLRVSAPHLRRRRRSVLRGRRPSIFLRRKPGRTAVAAFIHRDEREIIARN